MNTGSPTGLNQQLRSTWHRLVADTPYHPITARQLTDALNEQAGRTYAIQTVLTVLNRWVNRQHAAKVPMLGDDGQLQWGFIYLGKDAAPDTVREALLAAWMAPFTQVWCKGDQQLALYSVQEALLKSAQPNELTSYPVSAEHH